MGTIDRLQDLRNYQENFACEFSDELSQKSFSTVSTAEHEQNAFLRSVEDIKVSVIRFESLIRQLKDNYEHILHPSTFQTEQIQLENKVKLLMSEIQIIIRKTNRDLKTMQKDLKDLRESANSLKQKNDLKVRQLQYNAILKRFKETWDELNSVQQDYKNRLKKIMRTQLKLVDLEAKLTEEDLDEVIETGENILSSDILAKA